VISIDLNNVFFNVSFRDNQFKIMIELSLLTLLNLVGNNFCEYRDVGYDNYKSLLLAYSDASHEFGPLVVKKVIEESDNFKVAAIAVAAVKCPKYIMK